MGYFEDIQRTVLQIPRGKVSTYGEVAQAAGYPGTARQVAWALRDAEARGIPWQRVLGQNGKILLPGEAGLYQRTLLELEGVRFLGSRADMRHCCHRFKRSRASGKRRASRRPGAGETGTGYASRKRRSPSGS